MIARGCRKLAPENVIHDASIGPNVAIDHRSGSSSQLMELLF
jgi:hypothetical protein